MTNFRNRITPKTQRKVTIDHTGFNISISDDDSAPESSPQYILQIEFFDAAKQMTLGMKDQKIGIQFAENCATNALNSILEHISDKYTLIPDSIKKADINYRVNIHSKASNTKSDARLIISCDITPKTGDGSVKELAKEIFILLKGPLQMIDSSPDRSPQL